MMGRAFRAIGLIALFAFASVAGCENSGSIPSGSVLGSGTIKLRLVGIDTNTFATASNQTWLFVGVPQGIDPTPFPLVNPQGQPGNKDYTLSESVNGRTFNDIIIPPNQLPSQVFSNSVLFILPLPQSVTYFRVKMKNRQTQETILSNIVKAQPGTRGPQFNIQQPLNGATNVDHSAKYVWNAGQGLSSYFLLSFDDTHPQQPIDSTVETIATTWTVGAKSAVYYHKGHTPLKPNNRYLAIVFGIDGFGWGISATPTTLFTTRP